MVQHTVKPLPSPAICSRLLVSIQNASEARMAAQAGVPWIDLKSPTNGPLGLPEIDVARAVHAILNRQPQRSVALGELFDLQKSPPQQERALQIGKLFPFAKVGLSQTAELPWKNTLKALSASLYPTQLIPVIYADYDSCGAPPPESVVEFAVEEKSPYVLFDTYSKSGKSLIDFLQLDRLLSLKEWLASTSNVVLAGSLREQDVMKLQHLNPFAFAVRGAVTTGLRDSAVDELKLRRWLHLLQTTISPAESD